MKKRTLICYALCLSFVCAFALSCNPIKVKEKVEPVKVKTLTVCGTEPVSTSNYVGKVTPSKSAVVFSQIGGTVEAVRVIRGTRVKRGDIVAVIYSEAAKSAYAIAKATLEQAEDGYARAKKVYENGSITEVRMMDVSTQLEKAKASERSARRALEECNVTAPFNGVIGDVFVNRGENVMISAPIVSIMDVESVEVHISVPENEYSEIKVGAKVKLCIPALNKETEATVAVKGVEASDLSHSYDFTLKNISDPGSLMPGMVCKARVQTSDGKSIVIPASAVMTDVEGRYVWTVSTDSRVCKTYIAVGGFAAGGVVVSDGLEEGDAVIVEGSRKVSTGMKVKAE